MIPKLGIKYSFLEHVCNIKKKRITSLLSNYHGIVIKYKLTTSASSLFSFRPSCEVYNKELRKKLSIIFRFKYLFNLI